MTSSLTFSAECSLCVSDYNDHIRAVRASPIGEPVPLLPKKECERIDCQLYDAILDRLEDDDDMNALVVRLRHFREQMLRRSKGDNWQRKIEWQAHQEHLEELREAARKPSTAVISDDWNHSLPEEVIRVLQEFDEDRTAWLKLKTCWENAAHDKVWIVALGGPQRSGKTCAAGRWVSEFQGGRFITAADAVKLREAAVSTKDRSEIAALRGAPALVIDDVGRGAMTDLDRKRIVEIVRARESNHLPTTLTMVTGQDLPEALRKRARMAIAF